MAYTVNQLAKLSGVTVRALHFYDEIGLLTPSYTGDNGYRYYEEKELLLLQQILFFRELGFPLNEIQEILKSSSFDRVRALKSHKKILEQNRERTKRLIETIDKTIAKMERGEPMKDENLFYGFDPEKQKQYEKEMIERYGDHAKKNIAESRRRTKGWTKQDFEDVKTDYDEIHKALTALLEKGSKADSEDVQKLIGQHFQIVSRFWTPNKVAYAGLGGLYNDHPDFKKLYDSFHPELAKFMAAAMKVYADRNL